MGRSPKVSRKEVLDAAREAFAARGYEGTTLAEIGSRVGVSPAALLRHAPNKEALFTAAMASGHGDARSLMELFARLDPRNPRKVLRRLAERWVPFMESKLGENIVQWMRANTGGGSPALRLPFDPRSGESPPRRFLSLLEEYFIRARRAGSFRAADPRAAALAFLGSLHAYVFLHRVARIEPPIPLGGYIETVMEIWDRGALRRRTRSQ